MRESRAPGESRPPRVLEAVGIVFVGIAVALVAGIVANSIAPARDATPPALSAAALTGQVVFTLTIIACVLWWAKATNGWEPIGLSRPAGGTAKSVVGGVAAGVGLQAAVFALIYLVGRLFPAFDATQISGTIERTIGDAPLGSKLVLVVVAVVAAPVSEELLYRGMLLAALSARFGRVAGVIAASALFALAHLNAFSFALLFGIGLTFALLVRKTGSLAASIAGHIAFNLVAVIGLLAVTSYF